jgi:hypothetical protein
MLRALRYRALSALAVIGSCLGVYVVLAIAFHWLIGPTIANNPDGAAADKPASATATLSPAASFSTPGVLSELQPPPFGSKAQGLAVPAAPESTDAIPQKTPKKQGARKNARRQPSSSRGPWNFDFGGLFNNYSRPRF